MALEPSSGSTEPAPETDSGLTRFLVPAGLALLAALVLLAYSNSTGNAFALDDSHSIEQNAAIRSLDAASLRRFFTDLSAFSALPANWDYRPLLLVTYAINHRLSGYDPVSWHWFNIALHWIAAAGLFFLGRMLIGAGRLSPVAGVSPAQGDRLALAAAALFAIHPVTTGAVTYISARSSLLVAACLLPAMALYLGVIAGRVSSRWLAGAWLLFLAALLTKIEAIALAPVLLLAEVLFAPEQAGLPLWRRLPWRASWMRLLPFLVLAIAYGWFWSQMSTLDSSSQRSVPGVTGGIYLLTETRAWWHYVGDVIAPVRLVADETAYPISGAATLEELAAGAAPYSLTRALIDPRMWLAVTGWLLAIAAAIAMTPRFPAALFVLGAFLLFLAPTSSVVPLAEMVNGHRPYLPLAGMFVLATVAMWLLTRRLSSRPALVFTLTVALLAVPLLAATRAQNRVWFDGLSLWSDTVTKSPGSGRAQMNYGVALMARGRIAEAESRFRRALEISPNYHYAHTNLAIALAARGDFAGAAAAHDRAVEVTGLDASAYYYRGRFRAGRGDVKGAADDFAEAVTRNPTGLAENAALVEALERLGRSAEVRQIEQQIGPALAPKLAAERAAATALFGRSAESTALNDRGVAAMSRREFDEARDLFTKAVALDPGNPLPLTNMAILSAASGDAASATEWHAKAVAADPQSPTALYWRARELASAGKLDLAIADLQEAVMRPGAGVTELAALVECLHSAGRGSEASSFEARGAVIDGPAFQAARDAFRPLLDRR